MTQKKSSTEHYVYQKHIFKIMNFKLGINTKIMNAIFQQIEGMLSNYSRVLLVRADLPMNTYTETNTQLSKLFKKLRAYAVQEFKSHLGYIWVREQNKATAQHYHVALILNGHKIFYPSKLIAKLRQYWFKLVGKFPYIPKHCFYKLFRSNIQTLKSAIYRVSYLAKNYSKGYKPHQTKDFGSSRIKIKHDHQSPFFVIG